MIRIGKRTKVEEAEETPIIVGNKVNRLSFSAIDMYMRCGEQFRRRYILGEKTKPSIAMIDGISYHDSAAKANVAKRDGKPHTAGTMIESYVQTLREKTEGVELDWEEETENTLFMKAKKLWPDFARTVYAKYNPDMVEEWVELEIGGVPVVGVVDLTTKKKGHTHWANHVWDYKTSSRAKTQKDADNSLQLDLYSIITKKQESGLITFVKSANPYVATVRAHRTPQQLAWATQVIQSVWKSIQLDAFPLARIDGQAWWCSEKFCGWWSVCRGRCLNGN